MSDASIILSTLSSCPGTHAARGRQLIPKWSPRRELVGRMDELNAEGGGAEEFAWVSRAEMGGSSARLRRTSAAILLSVFPPYCWWHEGGGAAKGASSETCMRMRVSPRCEMAEPCACLAGRGRAEPHGCPCKSKSLRGLAPQTHHGRRCRLGFRASCGELLFRRESREAYDSLVVVVAIASVVDGSTCAQPKAWATEMLPRAPCLRVGHRQRSTTTTTSNVARAFTTATTVPAHTRALAASLAATTAPTSRLASDAPTIGAATTAISIPAAPASAASDCARAFTTSATLALYS